MTPAGLVERAIYYAILLLSTVVAVLLTPPLVALLPTASQSDFENVITAALAVLGYLISAFILYMLVGVDAIRRQYDPAGRFLGQYLSISRNAAGRPMLGIFSITFNARRGRYQLEGTSFDPGRPNHPTGSWTSSCLDMNIETRRLAYIYQGSSSDTLDRGGHGYCAIFFNTYDMMRGEGHFRDDVAGATEHKAAYLRITPAMAREMLQIRWWQPWKRRLSGYKDYSAFVAAYHARELAAAATGTPVAKSGA